MGHKSMVTMPSATSLSDLGQKVLLAIWRLGGIGQNYIPEDRLGTVLSADGETWKQSLPELMTLGFIETIQRDGRELFAVSPLGMAVLRQLEEDRLEELQ